MANKVTLVSLFAQGDVPQGTDFANLINSQVNLNETALQSMNGPLQTTELQAPLVSAATVNVTNLNATNINIPNASFTNLSVVDVSAAGNVYCSALRIQSIGVVSALGTTQAAAAQLSFTMTRGQGAADGQNTGYALMANKQGWIQYFKYEGTVSANLWPPTGGTINNLTANVPFPLAGGTSYTIMHFAASAYAVK